MQILLSPSHPYWCQRIKYVIFDDIHCISGEAGFDVWKKTMLLMKCPVIGLSAVVNNGDEFLYWIENIEYQRSKLFQTSKSRRICFITHHERLTDLNKYLYSNRQFHTIGLMNAK
ncbi:unnamed protein product [Rotaria sp. Silwood1]|nr:unnamed protein product [Rotaria sp. Silwood1]